MTFSGAKTSLCRKNDRNRVSKAVLGLSQDGACTNLFENFDEHSFKRDLLNETAVNQPLFSLVNTVKQIVQGYKQCCGSGSVRIRNFWPDPDPIRNFSPVVRIETPPPPHPQVSVFSSPLVQGGGIHTNCGRGGGGGPNSEDGTTLWSRYLPIHICTLCPPAWGRDTIHRQYAYMCEILIDRKFFAHFVRSQVTELMEGSREDEAA